MTDNKFIELIDALTGIVDNNSDMFQEERDALKEIMTTLIDQRDALHSAYKQACNGEIPWDTLRSALGKNSRQ